MAPRTIQRAALAAILAGMTACANSVLAAYTMGSAYAEFQEGEKGSITPGKLADLVILDHDIFRISPAEIRNVKVQTTITGGKVIYSAKP